MHSIIDVTIRAIGHRAHAMHSLTSFSSQSIIASGILTLILPLLASSPSSLPTTWVIPSSSAHIGLMFLIGALGFIAQALMTFGLQRETAGRGSMGMYAQIVFAGVYDKVIFHSKTSALSVVGTILIVGSALFVAVCQFYSLR
jgi:drug/metabolite transporter (DMT)-like permease